MSPYALPLLGRLAWIDVILLGWFLLVLISVAYVAWDAFRQLPEPGVIKWAWVLTTLYLGPVGAAFYILADKEPRPGEHERFVAPMWKQALGSTLHCVSGDAAGVIIAATVTGLLGLPMWFDMTAEYVLGFAFGLFIFQALFMKDMMGGSYRNALTSSFIPEWVSMNAMMAGMFPTMVAIMMGRDMRAMDPRELLYWGTMSLAIGVGFVTAYPVNWWLVSKGLKHGLMTVRPERAWRFRRRDTMGETRPKRSASAARCRSRAWRAHAHGWGLTCIPTRTRTTARRLRRTAPNPHPAADGHGGMHVMGADVTRPQIAAVSVLTPPGAHRRAALVGELRQSHARRPRRRGRRDGPGHDHDPRHPRRGDARHGGGRSGRPSASPRRPMPAATRSWRRASRTA